MELPNTITLSWLSVVRTPTKMTKKRTICMHNEISIFPRCFWQRKISEIYKQASVMYCGRNRLLESSVTALKRLKKNADRKKIGECDLLWFSIPPCCPCVLQIHNVRKRVTAILEAKNPIFSTQIAQKGWSMKVQWTNPGLVRTRQKGNAALPI